MAVGCRYHEQVLKREEKLYLKILSTIFLLYGTHGFEIFQELSILTRANTPDTLL